MSYSFQFQPWRLARAWWRDTTGLAAIEFAFIGPVVLAMSLAIMQVGINLFCEQAMEGALRAAARTGITNDLPSGYASREDYIRALLEQKSAGILSRSNPSVSVTERIFHTYADLNQDEPFSDLNNNGVCDSGEPFTDLNGNGVCDSTAAGTGAGNACDLVKYTVTYNASVPGLKTARQLMAAFIHTTDSSSGSIPMTVTTTVMNEPWNTTTSTGCNSGTVTTTGRVRGVS